MDSCKFLRRLLSSASASASAYCPGLVRRRFRVEAFRHGGKSFDCFVRRGPSRPGIDEVGEPDEGDDDKNYEQGLGDCLLLSISHGDQFTNSYALTTKMKAE